MGHCSCLAWLTSSGWGLLLLRGYASDAGHRALAICGSTTVQLLLLRGYVGNAGHSALTICGSSTVQLLLLLRCQVNLHWLAERLQ
jgi:hypothetical protein